LEDGIILENDGVSDSVVVSKEQGLETSQFMENGNIGSDSKEKAFVSWELKESNDLVNIHSTEVKEGTDPLDTALDSGSEGPVTKTNTPPSDPTITSQKEIPSHVMLPCVHTNTLSPLNFSNGHLPTTPLGPRVSQGQLDTSVKTVEQSSLTCSNMPSPKTNFPPSSTSSQPSTCTPSSISNLEDKVLFGPDSNVSGSATQKPKRKTFKPYWSKDFVSK
jgi:hypothetical protein